MPAPARFTYASSLLRPVAACLAAAAALIAHPAAGQTADARRLAAARAIFAVTLAAEKALGPCRVNPDAWMDYPVPAELAQRHLRLARADTAPPRPPATPAAALAPEGLRPDIFCTADEWERRRAAALEKLAPGERAALAQLAYTFPVFDKAMRRAIVIRDITGYSWSRPADGSAPRPALETVGVARIYARSGRRWRLTAEEPVYSGH